MNTYYIFLTIQYVIVFGLLFQCRRMLMNWKNKKHGALFFYSMVTLINSAGYLGEMQATNVESAVLCRQFAYLGKSFVAYALLLFVIYYCGLEKRIKHYMMIPLIFVHIFTYINVLTMKVNHLYYASYSFTEEGMFPHMLTVHGVWHHIYDSVIVVYIIYGSYHLIKKYLNDKNQKTRKCTGCIIISIIFQSVFFVLEAAKVADPFDLTVISYGIAALLISVALNRFDLMDTSKIAEDFVVERLEEAIIAVDIKGEISFFNKLAIKIFPELESNPIETIAEVKKALHGEDLLVHDGRKYRSEEKELKDGDSVVGYAYVFIDETERLAYLEELEIQKQRADDANKAKSAFLANMSHDIRTPINAVLGMDEMILRESSEDNILSYATDIQMAGKTLLSLINDILDFSKVEEGKMEIIPVQYELSSLVGDLVNLIKDRAVKKGLSLRTEVNENIPHLLYGDEIRIKQCVLNLLTNAVKYTHEGEVNLMVDYESKGENILLKFKVIDTGIGMKAEDMEALFSPFDRIEEERNRNIEGTGLGMSIVKNLLSLMDSELEVHSEYGKGSEFSFEIMQVVVDTQPVGDVAKRYNAMQSERKQYHQLFTAPSARILVVDDTEANLVVVENLLKRTEIKIDTATSGRDAISLADTYAYDCIFIDHMMPEMDGIETLAEIRKLTLNENTPCIVLTANAVSGVREKYLEAGFSDYMSKPVDGERLEKLLYAKLPDEKCVEYTEESSDPENVEMPEEVRTISAIDVDEGIKNCGSAEGFLSVLKVFHDTAIKKADEIETLYNSKDIDGYTIKVHALKSAARIIGAQSLSEQARLLEEAGKNSDTIFIEQNTDTLLANYRSLNKELSFLDGNDKDKEKISDELLKDAYETLLEACNAMDYGMAEDIIKAVMDYSLVEEDKNRFEKINDALLQLDWDEIENQINGRM